MELWETGEDERRDRNSHQAQQNDLFTMYGYNFHDRVLCPGVLVHILRTVLIATGMLDPLLMNAFNTVNLAAACILTSTTYAEQLGIPKTKWIYALGGAGTQDADNCETLHGPPQNTRVRTTPFLLC